MTPFDVLKQRLYAEALARPEELVLALRALHGDDAPAEPGLDFLDFYAIEWLDHAGWTVVDHAVAGGVLPQIASAWPVDVRTAMWVVDGWEGDLVLLRDVATEDEVAVHAPGLAAELPRRSVLRARVLRHEGRHVFSGEPDIWEPQGVLARMDLHRAWVEGGEPALLEHLASLRAGFRRQREERDAFVRHFGTDEVVFADADALGAALTRFVHALLNVYPMPSLGGRTRASAHRAEKGADPHIVSWTLGPTLTGPGRPGVIYDAIEGVHFLPLFGEFRAHLLGVEDHPDVVHTYLDDPGITRLPFRRVGGGDRLAALLGRPETSLDALLDPYKPAGARAAPSVLPGYED